MFLFSEHFPAIKELKELIEPLRFITSKKEYNKLKQADNTKEALDEFWLENTVNAERARELPGARWRCSDGSSRSWRL